ncbi:MAG: hypothetical protein CVT80_13380, partial [Alphaproteobacteria bacterium HGW-Alphaproteobacteria-2]
MSAFEEWRSCHQGVLRELFSGVARVSALGPASRGKAGAETTQGRMAEAQARLTRAQVRFQSATAQAAPAASAASATPALPQS